MPFGLKTMESLLERHPDHEGLLTALASGFTQYGYAFVQEDADEAEVERQERSGPGAARAGEAALSARPRLRAARARPAPRGDRREAGGRARLGPVVERLNKADVPLVYWTAASWALAIAAGKEDMALVAQLPAPGALMQRALALDEEFDEGALHEFFITWEPAQSATEEAYRRAKVHFDRALVLSKGMKLGPYVAYAEAVAVPRQDRAEFRRLLEHVLAADVDGDKLHRLANVLAQRRARMLLARADDLFS